MKKPKPYILVVEDEAAIRDMVRFTLEHEGFLVEEAESFKQAKLLIANHLPELILLDWMLPGQSGIDIINVLKQDKTTKEIPIILLTAKAEEENKLKGFAVGADDYIVKPFSPRLLVARIKAVLRRGGLVSSEGLIQIDDLCIDVNNQKVTIKENLIKLNPIEYRLLHFFVAHQNKIYSREQLLDHIWGGEVYIDERTVDVQIGRLRKILKPHGYDKLIQTVRGSGYRCATKG